MATALAPALEGFVLRVVGPLHAPLARKLRREVHALLRAGERSIVLDLARASAIDAGGIGELVRIYRSLAALHGMLRIVHARRWVREPLQCVGLYGLLSDGEGR